MKTKRHQFILELNLPEDRYQSPKDARDFLQKQFSYYYPHFNPVVIVDQSVVKSDSDEEEELDGYEML